MKNSNNEIRFETRVPLNEVMQSNPTTISSGATVAQAAAAMCHDDVGRLHCSSEEPSHRNRD